MRPAAKCPISSDLPYILIFVPLVLDSGMSEAVFVINGPNHTYTVGFQESFHSKGRSLCGNKRLTVVYGLSCRFRRCPGTGAKARSVNIYCHQGLIDKSHDFVKCSVIFARSNLRDVVRVCSKRSIRSHRLYFRSTCHSTAILCCAHRYHESHALPKIGKRLRSLTRLQNTAGIVLSVIPSLIHSTSLTASLRIFLRSSCSVRVRPGTDQHWQRKKDSCGNP